LSKALGGKSPHNETSYNPNEKSLPKPEHLPAAVVRYITVILGHNPVWAGRLKGVECPREGQHNIFDIRVFDEGIAVENGVAVENYHTLDSHPELVIFEGWIDRDTNTVSLLE